MENTQGKGFADARISNTALNSHSHGGQALTAKIDWISLRFENVHLDNLIEKIQRGFVTNILFEDLLVHTDAKEKWNLCPIVGGGSFLWMSDGSRSYGNARLILPGGFLATRTYGHVQHVCKGLSIYFGAVCTRIDLAIDDYDRTLDFDVIWKSIQSGENVGFRQSKMIESYGGIDAGKTIYLGTRRSNKYGRIYDRFGATKGIENCIRYEVEYKRGMADAVFTDYVNNRRDESKNILTGIIKSAFDFVQRKGKNLERATRCSWWESYLCLIPATSKIIKLVPAKKSIEKTIGWVRRSVSKALVKMVACVGLDALDAIIRAFMYTKIGQLSGLDKSQIEEFRLSPMTVDEILRQFA
jgi:hypothetical protein